MEVHSGSLPAQETSARSYELLEVLDQIETVFPDCVPLETQLRADPHLIWIKIGERRVINWLRQIILKERSGS